MYGRDVTRLPQAARSVGSPSTGRAMWRSFSATGQRWAPRMAPINGIENHGSAREYLVTVEGDVWTFTGEHERATIAFGDAGRTQTHHWEFRPEGEWITLCDRVATRID